MAKRKQHIKGFKGQRFSEEIRNLDKNKILIIPIDVAKNSHKALVSNYFGDILVPSFEFDNTLSGIKMLDMIIKRKSSEIQSQKIIVGLEPTGVYYENLYFSLISLGYNVIQVNPYSTSSIRTTGLNWCKTDEIDLCAIGQAIVNNDTTETVLHSGLWYNFKQVVRLHRAEIRCQAAIKNQIRAAMDRLFPGFQCKDIFSEFWCDASRLIMENYPLPSRIISLGEKRLKNFLHKHKIHLSQITIDSLFSAAKDAPMLSKENTEIHLFNLQLKLQDMRRVEENIRRFEIKMAEFLVHTPAILLLSIPYINVPSAAEFAAEVGPLSDFRHARQIIKKAGTNPSKHQTGKYDSTNNHITKLGMSQLRNIISIISNNLLHNKYFRKWHDEFVNNKKNKKLAKIVLGNKFIKISFSMMRKNKLFEPQDWDGENISDDPIEKLQIFLKENNATHLIDKLTIIAESQIYTQVK